MARELCRSLPVCRMLIARPAFDDFVRDESLVRGSSSMSHQPRTMTGKEKLVYMANQIAAFFGSAMPHDEAVAGIADHLNSCTSPSAGRPRD